VNEGSPALVEVLIERGVIRGQFGFLVWTPVFDCSLSPPLFLSLFFLYQFLRRHLNFDAFLVNCIAFIGIWVLGGESDLRELGVASSRDINVVVKVVVVVVLF